jgi:hypothetical protein
VARDPGRRLLVAAGLILSVVGLAACGGRFAEPSTHAAATRAPTVPVPSSAGNVPTTTATTLSSPALSSPSGTTTVPAHTEPSTAPAASRAATPAAPSTQQAITHAYEDYLSVLSGLDDTLNKAYLTPLNAVTTNRLAEATARQAASILDAKEHGVGMLRDDHVSIVMTGPNAAALADCQDEDHFYLVTDSSGTPDTFVARGYYAGSAQLVLLDGHWLVDTFTTTRQPCTY